MLWRDFAIQQHYLFSNQHIIGAGITTKGRLVLSYLVTTQCLFKSSMAGSFLKLALISPGPFQRLRAILPDTERERALTQRDDDHLEKCQQGTHNYASHA